MRKIILGVLLLVLATNVAGATAYHINDDLEMTFPVSIMPGDTTYYFKQEAGYAPDGAAVYVGFDESVHTSTYVGTLYDSVDNMIYECDYRPVSTGENTLHGLSRDSTGESYVIRFQSYESQNALRASAYVGGSGCTGGGDLREDADTNVWMHYTITIIDGDAHMDVENTWSLDLLDVPTTSLGFFMREASGNSEIKNQVLRKYTPNEPTVTVTPMDGCYKVVVTNNEDFPLTAYQVTIGAAELGITATDESWNLNYDYVPPGPAPNPNPEPDYDPTPGGRYSDQFTVIFPNDTGEMTVWSMIKNTIAAWGISVGSEIFWLFILPIPIAAYWIMTNSTELPIVVYLILGGIFVKVAPEVMQTPARIMLMFGITGMLYHFFKNRG